jgi:hypothetical protein
VKIEVLTDGKFHNVVKDLQIEAKRVYKSNVDAHKDRPYYEIWEIEKSDLRRIESHCMSEGIFFCHSNGEHRGIACDFLTINGVFTIAWQENSNKDTYNCLTDYFKECLGVTDRYKVTAHSVYLAKINGWTLSRLWRKLEG